MKIIHWIGKHTTAATVALTTGALLIAGVQFYTAKTTALSNWKGGGFGMYTEPHYDARAVWLVVDDGAAGVRLWPAEPGLIEWRDGVSLRGAYVLDGLIKQAAKLRFFPTDAAASKLLDKSARMRWLPSLMDPIIEEPESFARERLSLVVSERTYDMWEKTVSAREVFRLEGDAQ